MSFVYEDTVRKIRRASAVHIAKNRVTERIVHHAAQLEAKEATDRMKELAPAVKNMEKPAREFSDDPEQILPEPGALESAKGYREKKALGKDKVEAAVESVKQEEERVQAEKHRKRQYTR